jgi:hypothetical protein
MFRLRPLCVLSTLVSGRVSCLVLLYNGFFSSFAKHLRRRAHRCCGRHGVLCIANGVCCGSGKHTTPHHHFSTDLHCPWLSDDTLRLLCHLSLGRLRLRSRPRSFASSSWWAWRSTTTTPASIASTRARPTPSSASQSPRALLLAPRSTAKVRRSPTVKNGAFVLCV